VRRAAGDQIGEEPPDRVGRRRAAGEEVVDLHDVVERVDLGQGQRQLGIVGDEAALDAVAGQVDRLQAVAHVEVVALGRQPAVDRARADRDQDLAPSPERAQRVDVIGVAQPALDQAEVAVAGVLQVGQGRRVELDQLEQRHQPLVDVEERHVTAEAAGQRGRRDPQLARRRGHGSSPSGLATATTLTGAAS
jgi:hypothetical protein